MLWVVISQALGNVIEAPGNRQRRGRQDHRVELLEQPLPENLADIDWRGGQEDAFVPPLVPIHKIPLVRFKEERQLLAQLEASPRDARQLFRLSHERCKFRLHAFQRGYQRVVGFAVLLQKCFAFIPQERKPPIARRKQFEKAAAAFPDSLRLSQQRRRSQMQQAHRLIRVARQLLKPEIRNLPPEIVAGYFFPLMPSIEYHP